MYTHVCQYTMYLCVYYPREDYVYFDNLQPPTNHNDASYDMRNRSNCFMISQQHRSCKGEVRWSQGANWCSNMTRITDAVVFKTQGSDVMVFMIIMTLTRFFRACSMKAVECIPLGEWITIMCKGAIFQKEDQAEMLLISQKAWKTKGEEESEGWSQMRGSRMPRRNFPPDASGHAENMAILATRNSFEAIARQRNITTKKLEERQKRYMFEWKPHRRSLPRCHFWRLFSFTGWLVCGKPLLPHCSSLDLFDGCLSTAGCLSFGCQF